MSNINTSFIERVRYTLYHKEYGSLVISDPEGWDSDEKEIERNEEYHGIFAKFSNNLKFLKEAKDYLTFIDEVYGVNADVRLIKEEKHPKTDLWETTYSGFLDMSTFEEQDNKVSIKFNSGGLEQILKARENENLELDRATTIDGIPITPLEPKILTLEGRRIFLKTQWETKIENNYASMQNESDDGNVRGRAVGIPMEMTSQSHEEAGSSSASESVSFNNHGYSGTIGSMFFLASEENRKLQVQFSLSFKVEDIHQNFVDEAKFMVALNKCNSDYNLVDRINLLEINAPTGSGFTGVQGNTYTIPDFNQEIEVLKGESLALEFYQDIDFKNRNNAIMRMNFSNITCKMSIEENSKFEKTDSKFYLAHDVADRLCEIMTNQKKTFYSKYFGRKDDLGYEKDGPGAYLGLTHGFWVRGFDKLPLGTDDNPNLFKPFTTSFKDFQDSFSAISNIGLGIEKTGFAERIVIEDMKYFYNRNVTIKLPNQVKNVKRTTATKYYYSSIEIGYEKGESYDEAQGLDEYNGKSTFTTIITAVKATYTKISKYVSASYAREFARRKPFFRYPSLDTKYDSMVFVMDLKKNLIGNYLERKWQDDFENAPTGVFSPETATNLRLSPVNLLLRHGWVIVSGLTKYATDYIRYGSSTSNSKLKTKLRTDADYKLDTSATVGNGKEYAEDGNIINSELPKARYIPKFIEFEHVVNFDIMKKIEGYTIMNNEKVYNFYGLIEFINEKNETERGFLMSLKPNGVGNWKLLKLNN